MVSNRGRDTRLELALRQRLHHDGYRYWTHRRPEQSLRCVADLVFPRLRLAVFIDGCFWHVCPMHGTTPVLNGTWWRAKLEGNEARDHKNNAALRAAGWTVLRLWEHEALEEMQKSVAATVALLRRVK
jgi:DNA mismatch endonuclease, patch repair protein